MSTPAEKLKQDLIQNKFNGDEDAYWQAYAHYAETEEEETVETVPAPQGWMTKKDTKSLDQELHTNSVWAEQERARIFNEQREAQITSRDEEAVPAPPRSIPRYKR